MLSRSQCHFMNGFHSLKEHRLFPLLEKEEERDEMKGNDGNTSTWVKQIIS